LLERAFGEKKGGNLRVPTQPPPRVDSVKNLIKTHDSVNP